MEPTAATAAPKKAKVVRPTLDDMALPLGKRVRLNRLFYGHGLKNGTLLILPIDQGLEHGPIDFFSATPLPPIRISSGDSPLRVATTGSPAIADSLASRWSATRGECP